jgi:hypothetical protein
MDRNMLQGTPGPMSSTTKWITINQARPDAPSWKLQRLACSQWSMNGKLNTPLGQWLYSSDRLRRQWPSYLDYDLGDLFIHTDNGFTKCVSIDPLRFSPILEVESIPISTCYPVFARKVIHGDTWIPTYKPPSILSSTIHDSPATFLDFLTTLDPWEQDLFSSLSMEVDCYEFIELVNSQSLGEAATQLLTVSDGSDDSGSMTLSWIIALLGGRQLARCAGPVSGPFGSSFCAEGYGILSVSLFLV